jgi:hypothetical protein
MDRRYGVELDTKRASEDDKPADGAVVLRTGFCSREGFVGAAARAFNLLSARRYSFLLAVSICIIHNDDIVQVK